MVSFSRQVVFERDLLPIDGQGRVFVREPVQGHVNRFMA